MSGQSPEFISVTYTYRANALPMVPQRVRRSWTVVAFHDTIHLPVLKVEDWEAPVVAIIAREGAELEVRRHGDQFLRPVLDGAVPLTVERLHARAAETIQWKDDPFHRYFEPKAIDYVEADWKRCVRMREPGAGLAAHAADLLIVDGIVHVRCPLPHYEIRSLKRRDETGPRGIGLGWELSSRVRDDLPEDWSAVVKGSFPLDRRDEALRYVDLVAALTGLYAAPAPRIELLRPDLLPARAEREATDVDALASEVFEYLGAPFNKWTMPYKDAIPKPLKLDLIAAQEALDSGLPEASRIALDILWAAMTKALNDGVDLARALPSVSAKARLAHFQTVERGDLSGEDLEALADLGGPA